jgi:hypothetical protein
VLSPGLFFAIILVVVPRGVQLRGRALAQHAQALGSLPSTMSETKQNQRWSLLTGRSWPMRSAHSVNNSYSCHHKG